MTTREAGSENEPARSVVVIAVYLSLAALIWIVFHQTLGHKFVQYDDASYVYENREIAAGLTIHGLAAAFVHPHARNWHPLTTISHMLDCQLFGLNPAGPHLVNLLLHTTAALLLFSALRRMTGALWCSAFVTAVFAIHPLRAESVAWVAERKDVLSAVFFMLTLRAYVRYAQLGSAVAYLSTILFFALGLMSKPMLVTLPLLLLLLDYWPLARFRSRAPALPANQVRTEVAVRYRLSPQLVREKIPFLVLSSLSAVATFIAQRVTVAYSDEVPLSLRLGNVAFTYLAYIGQMFWPARLAVFYPHVFGRIDAWQVALAFALIGAVTAIGLALRKRRPYLIVGWLWYLVCLLPVIGLIQVGLQERADRYTYLPQIGLYIALTWAAANLPAISARRYIRAPLAAAVITVLAWRGSIQTSYWRDTETLWRHALAVTTDNDIAQYNVAVLSLEGGRLNEAISHFQQALNAHGDNRESHYHLSVALLHNALGNALAEKGRMDEAILHYRAAVELREDFADAHSNLAGMLVQKGKLDEAIAHYETALAVPPEDAPAHVRLAMALERAGCQIDAIAHYRRALELTPDSIAALTALARILATSPNLSLRNADQAVALAENANRLSEGKNLVVLRTLAAIYAESGRSVEAAAVAARVLCLATKTTSMRALSADGKTLR